MHTHCAHYFLSHAIPGHVQVILSHHCSIDFVGYCDFLGSVCDSLSQFVLIQLYYWLAYLVMYVA